jgi:hypothetical protein
VSEVAELSALLALVYLSDCLYWMRSGALALRSLFGMRFRAALPSRVAGNARAGFVWLDPLPPLGTLFVCEPWRVALSPDGMCTLPSLELERGEREAFDRIAVPWSDVREVRAVEKQLLVDGRVFASCATAAIARELAKVVEFVRVRPREQREDAIDLALEDALDADELRELVEDFERGVRPLRVLCNAMFLLLALGIPLALYRFGVARTWPWLLAALLVLHSGTVFCFWRRARSSAGARGQLVLTALSPLQAVRAIDLLARPTLARFHPLAASALFDERGRRDVARSILIDNRYPRDLDGSSTDFGVECERWYRGRLAHAMDAHLRAAGVEPDELLAPPEPEDESKRSYCPRCALQVELVGAPCPDCSTPLQPFAAT